MRILSLSAVVCSLVFAGCTKMPEYVEQDEYRSLTPEEIEANVINVFGTTFDPNQNWSTTVNNSITITANANLENIVKVQILTESPFFNEDAKVLNEIAAKNGETVELYYDAPADYEQLIAACVNDKNVYYIQVFNVGQKAVSFSSAAASTRGTSNSVPDISLIKLKAPKFSFNAMRTQQGDICKIKDDTGKEVEYSIWKNSGWENEMMWEPADGNTFDNDWKMDSEKNKGHIYRDISGFADGELDNIKTIVNAFLNKKPRNGDYSTNGKSNNIKKVRSSINFTLNNNYVYTDGINPVTLIPIQIYTTEFKANHVFYYYFNPKDIPAGMDEVDYIKTLPKYKAVQVERVCSSQDANNGVFMRNKEFLLPYYKETPHEGENQVSAIFPAGYKIGFLNMKHDNDKYDIANCKYGCTYGDGRLNYEVNHIQGHFNSAMDSSLPEMAGRQEGKYSTKEGMQWTDPRIAIFTANNKTYMCFEDGADCSFCDMIFEIGSGTEQLEENQEVGNCTYTYCFEDREDGDYDMNDVVIKAQRIDNTHIRYSLEACGAYDELYLRNIEGNVLNGGTEIHAMFGVSTETFVNTNGSNRLEPIQETIVVNPNFSLANPDQQVYIYNKTFNRNIYLAKKGEDPHGIMIPYDYKYPLEKTHIQNAYKEFLEWGKDASTNNTWYLNPETGEVYTLSSFSK